MPDPNDIAASEAANAAPPDNELPATLPDPPPAAAAEIAPLEPAGAAVPSTLGGAYRAGIDVNPIASEDEAPPKGPVPPVPAGHAAPPVAPDAPEGPVPPVAPDPPAAPKTAGPTRDPVEPEARFREADAPRFPLPPRGMFPTAFDRRATGASGAAASRASAGGTGLSGATGPLVDSKLRANPIPGGAAPPLESNYDPRDWYWLASDGRLYGSARQDFVEDPNADEAYATWKSAGNQPSAWPKDDSGAQSDQALADLLAAYGLEMDPPDLDEVKAECTAEINRQAEEQRILYATPGDLMVMTYVEKVAQARAAIGDPDATPEKYPMLAASIGIDGETVVEVAETVLDANLTWMSVNASIEAERKMSNAEIAAAPDEATARAVTPDWPTP